MTPTDANPAPARRRDRRTVRPAREDVRERVLEAGREVFAEVGYHRASLDQIATRAGFSKGAVYSNFDGKDDLFLVLLEQETRRIRDGMGALVAAAPARPGRTGLRQDLRLLAEAMLAEALDGQTQRVFAEFRAHAAADTDLARRTAAVRAPLVAETARVLREMVGARGHRLAVDAEDAALLLLSLSNGLALEQVGVTGGVVGVESLTALLSGLVAEEQDA